MIRSTDSSKYLTKCHKGWYLHVVAWRGRNDWCAVRRWFCVSSSDGPGLLHGFELCICTLNIFVTSEAVILLKM